MLVNGEHVSGAQVRGIVPRGGAAGRQSRRAHERRLARGSRAGQLPHCARDSALAQELGVKVGDTVMRRCGARQRDSAWVSCRACADSPSAASSPRACTNSIADSPWSPWQDAARLYRLGDGVTGVQLSLAGSVPRADDRARRRARARRRLLRQRLDAQARQFLSLHRDHEVNPVRDPVADRGRRGVQHRLDAGDGGEREAIRYRHPAHDGLDAAQHPRHLHRAGGDHRSRSARCAGVRLGVLTSSIPGEPGARPGTPRCARNSSTRASIS